MLFFCPTVSDIVSNTTICGESASSVWENIWVNGAIPTQCAGSKASDESPAKQPGGIFSVELLMAVVWQQVINDKSICSLWLFRVGGSFNPSVSVKSFIHSFIRSSGHIIALPNSGDLIALPDGKPPRFPTFFPPKWLYNPGLAGPSAILISPGNIESNFRWPTQEKFGQMGYFRERSLISITPAA